MQAQRAIGLVVGLILVVIGSGAATVAHAPTFALDSRADAVDTTPGDGICATAALPSEGVRCTLRAAIQEANALAGADLISLPPGTYLITLLGNADDAGVTGDLDVTSEITIVGAGRSASIID